MNFFSPKNHKTAAFYITALLFCLPFAYAVGFNDLTFKQPSHDKFSVSLEHFITQPVPPTPEPTPEEPEPEPEPEVEPEPPKPEEVVIAQPEPPKPKPKKKRPRPKPRPQQQIAGNQNGDDVQNFVAGVDVNPFLNAIVRAVNENRRYPPSAQRMGREGRLLIEFTWTRERKLQGLRILEKSRYEILDKSALETIRAAAASFPTPERDAKIRFPFEFSLMRN